MLNIINHVKNVDFHNVFNQLIFVYKNINVELKQMFRVFITFIIVNEFMKQLKKRKFIWWKLYNEHCQQSNLNINSYRQVNFNFISSNLQRSNQKQQLRFWQLFSFNLRIDYNQNQSYRANSSQYSYIDYRNQQKLENVEYQNYRQSTSSSSIEQKQIANSSSSQNDRRNAYDSSSNIKNSNSYRVDY